MFSIEIPIISWILLGLQLSAVLFLFFFLLRPLRAVKKLPLRYEPETGNPEPEEYPDSDPSVNEFAEAETVEEKAEGQESISVSDTDQQAVAEPEAGKMPKVSVVVYSKVDEEVLTDFLTMASRQDYPDYEIIVVCDASFETSGMLSEKYAVQFPDVYITFIPPGSHNLSRRKLALTLGIKAATGDIVVTTVANAVIPGDKWLSSLVAPFIINPEFELCLGYSHPDFSEMTGPGKFYKEFFALLTDSRWIGYAIMGKPYRGDGFNLAMRRNTFFRCKGYSKTMHLHTGEDDLFVNDIADKHNTAVSISPDSILTTRWDVASKHIFNLRRSQYDFTARWLPLAPFVRAGAASLSQWFILFTGIAAGFVGWPSIIPAIAAFCIWVIFFSFESSIYHKAATKLQSKTFSWQVPLFWLIKPINNLYFRAGHRSSRFKNFTWQRHKMTK